MPFQGIPNVGLSCWLSAGCQCLLRVPQLVRILLTDSLSGPPILAACGTEERGEDVSRGCTAPIATMARGAVAREFRDLARSYWRTEDAHIPSNLTRRLLDSMVTYRPESFAYDQLCDSHEAVVAIMEALHESFRELPEIEEYDLAPSEGIVRLPEWVAFNKINGLSLFTEVFQVQIAQKFGEEESVHHEWGLHLNPREGESAQMAIAREYNPTKGEDIDGKMLTKAVVYAPPALLVTCATGGLKPCGSTLLRVAGFDFELVSAAFHHGNHWTALGVTPETSKHIYGYFDDEVAIGVSSIDQRIDKLAKFLVYRRSS